MTSKRDRELGMDRRIFRRDFLNGIAVGVGGSLMCQPLMAAFMMDEFAKTQQERAVTAKTATH